MLTDYLDVLEGKDEISSVNGTRSSRGVSWAKVNPVENRRSLFSMRAWARIFGDAELSCKGPGC